MNFNFWENFNSLINKFASLSGINSKYIPYIAAGAVLVISLIGGGFYLYHQNQKSGANSPQAAQAEVKKLVAEVGKLIELPLGEDPTVATVTDVTKLKDQPFFAKAKNGDKVLIYTNAKKAILYDPKAKKVIDVAPINIGTQSAQIANPSALPLPKPTPTSTHTPLPTVSPQASPL